MSAEHKNTKNKRILFRIEEEKIKHLQVLYGIENISDLFVCLIDERINAEFSHTVDKPLIRSMSSKYMLANRITKMMPPHKIYVEPFANTAAALLCKEPSIVEVYNDLDGDVTNLYRVIKEHPIALHDICVGLPYSEQIFREIKGYSEPTTYGIKQLLESDNPVHRAAIYFYTSHVCRLLKSGGYVFSGRSSYAKAYAKDIGRIKAVSERIQKVEIQCNDYRKIINRYGKRENSFFFVDPPYLDTDCYYPNSFSLEEHKRLANKLLNIKGKFLICHYSDIRFNRLYKGCWYKDIYVVVSSMKALPDENGVNRKPRKVLWFYANYDLNK